MLPNSTWGNDKLTIECRQPFGPIAMGPAELKQKKAAGMGSDGLYHLVVHPREFEPLMLLPKVPFFVFLGSYSTRNPLSLASSLCRDLTVRQSRKKVMGMVHRLDFFAKQLPRVSPFSGNAVTKRIGRFVERTTS